MVHMELGNDFPGIAGLIYHKPKSGWAVWAGRRHHRGVGRLAMRRVLVLACGVGVVAGGCTMTGPVDAIGGVVVHGVVRYEDEPVAGARVEGVVYVSGCDRFNPTFPLDAETDAAGEYRLALYHMTARESFHACVRMTATDAETGRTGTVSREGVLFLIAEPYDSARIDIAVN